MYEIIRIRDIENREELLVKYTQKNSKTGVKKLKEKPIVEDSGITTESARHRNKSRKFEQESDSLEEYEVEIIEEDEEEEQTEFTKKNMSQTTKMDTQSNNMHTLLKKYQQSQFGENDSNRDKSFVTEESEINDDDEDDHQLDQRIKTFNKTIN